MVFRVFITVVLLISAYLVYDIVRMSWVGYGIKTVEQTYSLGNPDGDITMSMFLDYNCSHCKEMHKVIQTVLERDPGAKIVPRPINTDVVEGINPVLVVYAAAKQGRFQQMHEQLIENYRVIDDVVLENLADTVGVDIEQLRQDIGSQEVIDLANNNIRLFNEYGFNAVPSYVIGNKYILMPDMASNTNDFLTAFNQMRER